MKQITLTCLVTFLGLMTSTCIFVKAQESTEEVTTTSIPTTQEVIQDDNAGAPKTSTTAEFLPTPTINSNIVSDLIPSLRKNILAAKNQKSENNRNSIFGKNRQREKTKPKTNNAVVRNSTAAEILLKKLQNQHRIRTYHDPGFKSRKVVRRPRVKTLEELRSESKAASAANVIQSINKNSSTSSSIFQDADSPILTSNVLLLGADQKQNVATPQGSQPFDWSKRQKFKNRFRLFKSNPTTSTTSSTIITKKSITEIPSTTTAQPATEKTDTTEIHVVTSLSDEISGISPTLQTSTAPAPTKPISVTPTPTATGGSYQFISMGTPNAKDNVLELERLFLNENLKPEQDSDKIKRKVTNSNGFFFQSKPKPSQADLYESNNSQNRYEPSTKPPINYKAPSIAFQLPDINDALEPERVKDFIEDDAILNDSEEYEYDQADQERALSTTSTESIAGHEMILDDMIIKSIEEALAIRVPNDPMIRHRDINPTSHKPFTSNEASASNSYVFEYTTKAEDNLVTHSRKETADEYGVVRGVYEILEPNCVIRRIEYQADHRHGFQILGITQRSCQEAKRKFHPTVATSGFIPPPPPPKTTPEDIQRRVFSTPAPIVVSTTITTVLPKAPSVVPKRSSVVPKRTSVVPNVTVRPQTSYTVVSTNSPKPEFVSTNSPNTFPIFVSTKLPSSSPIFVSTKLPEKSSNNLLSSQPGILLGDAQLPDFIPVSTAAPSGSDEISHSLGASGFKGVQFVKSQSDNNPRKQRQRVKPEKQSTSPPLFGGFSPNDLVRETPKRPNRPKKPQPVYQPVTSTVGPTFKPEPVKRSSTAVPTPTYDPFSFQTTPRPILKERKDFKNYVEDLQDEIQASIRTVTPQSLGYDDDESTIVPVYLTSDLPELRRVPKDAGSGGPAPTLSTAENEIIDRADTDTEPNEAFKRRNMLMNIILRPGGGDKSRALPRPKVDVKADGPNVIIIRMTFPDNENIQGLRAFTPTQEETVDQFSAINDILPPNTSVERISANQQSSVNNNAISRNEKLIRRDPVPIAPKPTPSLSFPEYDDNFNNIGEEYEYYEDYEDYYSQPLTRPVRQPDPKQFAKPPKTTAPPPKIVRPSLPPSPTVDKPTRPTRPSKPFKFPSLPARPPQPPVLLGQHPKIPPPWGGLKKSPPPPPSPPSPPSLPPSLRKNGKKSSKIIYQKFIDDW